jgi:hypothetical protein
MAGGRAEPPRCQKSGGGGKEATASVESGRPREAVQVSGFRGAGNNSLLSRENIHLFLRRGIITSVSNTTEDV